MCYPLRTSSKLCCFRVFSSLLLKLKNKIEFSESKKKYFFSKKNQQKMLGGIYNYLFGSADGEDFQKAEEKLEKMKAQVKFSFER